MPRVDAGSSLLDPAQGTSYAALRGDEPTALLPGSCFRSAGDTTHRLEGGERDVVVYVRAAGALVLRGS